MKYPYRIALVNYLNSKPFLYGLENIVEARSMFDVRLYHPSECARAFDSGEVDIALVPVGAMPGLRPHKMITPFGIAADDEVRTVCIFSQDPPEQWKKVWLDNHSRTSVLLAKLLLEEYYHLDVEFFPMDIRQATVNTGEAILMIGDKVFDFEDEFSYKLDLAAVWKKWTGFPFVFAAWVASPDLPDDVEKHLTTILAFGIENIPAVIKELEGSNPLLPLYYQHYIRYTLDPPFRKGMLTFLQKIS